MKKSVLLSIIGVLLVVGVGITFAYFTSGVEVSGDGSTVELQPGDMIKVTYDAGDSSLNSTNLIPGDTVSKTFTVTVTPTETEKTAVYAIYLDLTNNTFVKCDDSNYNSITNACIKDYEELTYTIKDGDNVLATGDLTGKTGKVKLLTETKTVDIETTFTYTLEITFHETNADQNHNMDKSLIGNVVVEFSAPPANEYILASANAPTNSTTDWTNNGTGITYYYAGDTNEVNNWVSFAGFYWRIIRINGDGSIRMIYQGVADSPTPDAGNMTGEGTQIGTSAFNSSNNNKTYVGLVYNTSSQHGYGTNSTIMTTLNNWYNDNIENDSKNIHYEQYIDTGAGFCSDRNTADVYMDSAIHYAPFDRYDGPASLQCNTEDILSQDNGKLPNPIGLVTSDEAVLTGITWNTANTGSYLYTGQTYWTMSPSHYSSSYGAYVFYVYSSGNLYASNGVTGARGVRPVINLKDDIQISGSGTTSDPFVVVGAE